MRSRPAKPRLSITELAAKRTRCRAAKARGEECTEFQGSGVRGQESGVIVPQPPPLDIAPTSTRAIVTVVAGAEAERLFRVSGPYMRAYAERLGADLVVCRWPGHPAWPMSSKFQAARALDHYERIAYVDADVLLRPGCLDLFDACRPDEFGAVDEFPWHHFRPKYNREHEYIAFRRRFGFKHEVNLPWYFNLGVYVASRQHQPYLLPPSCGANIPVCPAPADTQGKQECLPHALPVHHCSEQDWINCRIYDAYLAGDVKVRMLDRRANWQNWTDPLHRCAPPDAVLHWSGAGSERRSRAELMRERARHAPLDHPWTMDARHRDWIKATLLSGRFRRVLEIGAHEGYVTTALCEALRAGAVDEVHVCDPTIAPRLEDMKEAARPRHLILHPLTSVDLLRRYAKFDLVVVDGDHRLDNVREETRLLLTAGVPAVFAHDTRASEWGYADCDGPPHLREAFLTDGYQGIEDAAWRSRERTERGLFFAARAPEILEIAAAAAKSCGLAGEYLAAENQESGVRSQESLTPGS